MLEPTPAPKVVQSSARLLQGAFDGSPDAMLLADGAHQCLDANQAACELFGVRRSVLQGRHLAEIYPTNFDFAAAATASLEQGRLRGRMHHVGPDGERRELQYTVTSNVAPGAHLWVLHELKGGELVDEPFRQLLESAPDGMIILGVDARIAVVNARTEELFGWARHELIGQPIEVLVPERSRTAHAGLHAVFLRNPRPRRMGSGLRLTALRKDGTEFPVEISLSPMSTTEGTFVIAAVRDATERRNAEQALHRTEEQLRQAQKMEAIGLLAGGVAHDFNNLLTVILGYASMASESLEKGTALREDIDEIRRAAGRARDLTQQLLAFGRRQVLQPRVFDLNQELASLEKMLRRLIGEDIELSVLTPASIGKVHADPGQFEQIVMNLTVNARDAMPKGGKLTIETANVELSESYSADHAGVAPGAYVMLAVTDTGVGMDPDTCARIFEPFFTTKERGKGTGLGLSTVFGIVQQSGGHIWVYSEPTNGTTFKVYLPRTDQPVDPPGSLATSSAPPRGSETILIVEDDDQVRAIVHTVLQRNGYAVLVARDGEEAIVACDRHPGKIDLVITDVIMPRMSGKELTDRLGDLRPELQVLFMSGYTDSSILRHGILEGEIAFLQKPVTPDVLLRKVRDLLDAAAPRQSLP